MNIEPVVENVEEEPENPLKNVENNNVYQKEKGGKKDEKLILTTQYIVDNVLGAVSEARFNMKTKGTKDLTSLIGELKAIYEKANFKP